LEKCKKENPEKYKRSHPNNKGSTPKSSSSGSATSTLKKINLVGSQEPLTKFPSTDIVSGTALPVIALEEPKQKNSHFKPRLQQLYFTIKLDHLGPSEQKPVWDLIQEFAKIFMIKGDKLQSNIKEFHETQTKDHLPIFVKNYRFHASVVFSINL
jgi:hypothetical protein